MTDSFGFQEALDQEVDLEHNPTARVEELKARVLKENVNDPEDIMLLIMEIFTIEEIMPEPGKFYTFIYNAKTPGISYDQHPLIACMELFRWGFRGLNFHWGEPRNYTWEEIQGYLHIINTDEIMSVRSLPYAQYLINN